MRDAQPKTIYLEDYQPPAFLIDETDLRFELEEEFTTVTSRLLMRRNPEAAGAQADAPLVLDGQELVLEKLSLNGTELLAQHYSLSEDSLTIAARPELDEEHFILECRTRIRPQENTSLEGLYKSSGMFCTQCEAEGFRKITYYLDRPDVMAKFTTCIVADKERYPILLSNGNAVEHGEENAEETGGPTKHWIRWRDPFRKPCYLFALVAGQLSVLEDSFTTMSGREIRLQIFVEEKDLDKCDHAMSSLKNAMAWDERVFGREYDLDIFMIVAVDDFNMGAMENKGLNIFNTSCVLANPATATDTAFQRVESVVAHEYFHNWSGNRITCRDWFQLSLKEGFTVYRDSEFSADMGSPTVKRIQDVSFLRTAQFAEDAGPMAHSIRPDSYMEISNFYTLTIYEKGAEVVRMISQILGPDKFRQGSDLYFERHDGQAVTTEDFVKAMEEASGIDLTRFRNWYSQAGTPELKVRSSYDESSRRFTLQLDQYCRPTPGQAEKPPFHIPLRLGLVGPDGEDIPLVLEDDQPEAAGATDRVLDIVDESQTFVFRDVPSEPVPSLLRGFSAPVKLHYDYSREELVFLMTHDSDGFNRWNASQQLAVSIVNELLEEQQAGRTLVLNESLLKAFAAVLTSAREPGTDREMITQLLSLPSEAYLSELAGEVDVPGIHKVREYLRRTLGRALSEEFAAVYRSCVSDVEYRPDAESIGRRALKNLCLNYLVATGEKPWLDAAQEQYRSADNMTDANAALRMLVNSPAEEAAPMRESALRDFYLKWKREPLVVDQWFSIQASSTLPGTLDRVKALMQHEAFNIRNPNRVRSVIGAFCSQNAINFHDASGAGYEFLADQVLLLNELNPQIASRLLTPLTRWKKYDQQRQDLMRAQLKRIRAHDKLSRDVFEVVEKSLA